MALLNLEMHILHKGRDLLITKNTLPLTPFPLKHQMPLRFTVNILKESHFKIKTGYILKPNLKLIVLKFSSCIYWMLLPHECNLKLCTMITLNTSLTGYKIQIYAICLMWYISVLSYVRGCFLVDLQVTTGACCATCYKRVASMLRTITRVASMLHATTGVASMLHATTRVASVLHATTRVASMLHATTRVASMLHAITRVVSVTHFYTRVASMVYDATRVHDTTGFASDYS